MRLASFVIVIVVAAGCHSTAAPTTLPRGPLASPMAAWIPVDVLLVIALTGPGSAEVDDAAAALGWAPPGELAGDGPSMWMVLEAEVTARCREVGEAQVAELVADGGTTRRAEGSTLVIAADDAMTTVIRDGVACAIGGGASSRRAHHAMRLAALLDDERLLRHADARAALAALPEAPVVLWGDGDLIGSVYDRQDAGLAQAIARLGPVAVAAVLDEEQHKARVTLVVATEAAPGRMPDFPTEGFDVDISEVIPAPAGEPLPPLPRPTVDENVDVPESEAYRAAIGRLVAELQDAVKIGELFAELESRAVKFWRLGWGPTRIEPAVVDGRLRIEATWTPATWPIPTLRDQSQATVDTVRAGARDLRSAYQARIEQAAQIIAELVRIRARDVAEWDRAQMKRQP